MPGIPELLACPKALLELLEQAWLEVSLQGEQREEQGGCFGIWVSAWSHPTSLARPLVLLLEKLPFASFQNCQWKGMNLSDGGTLEVQKWGFYVFQGCPVRKMRSHHFQDFSTDCVLCSWVVRTSQSHRFIRYIRRGLPETLQEGTQLT